MRNKKSYRSVESVFRYANEKRYAPKDESEHPFRKTKTDAQKIAEQEERDAIVARMRGRLRY